MPSRSALLCCFLPWLIISQDAPAADAEAGTALFPHNSTRCITAGHPPALCAHFTEFNSTGCIATAGQAIGSHDVFRCLNASRCLELYGVPLCVGPRGFNYSSSQFNHSVCVQFAAEQNLTRRGAFLFGGLSPGVPSGCDSLLLHGDHDGDDTHSNASATPPPPQLPRFHPCAGALGSEGALRMAALRTRGQPYQSHVVVALSPNIGPVSGGARVSVCGLGFPRANEAVGHLACIFTDGRYKVGVHAMWIDEHQVQCDVPDFSLFAVGLPHNVSLEVSTDRGATWTNNRVPFTYYSTRPAIDAFGRPLWGYEGTFSKAAWQVAFDANHFGSHVEPLYSPTGHELSEGRPSEWDGYRDPFHATGPSGSWQPVDLDVGDRMNPAADEVARARHSQYSGVEGSWGDRTSFLRAHNLVPDIYRQDIVAARARMREEAQRTNNGVM